MIYNEVNMKNRLTALFIIVLSLLYISCDFSIADLLNEKLELTPPIYLSYTTEYGKTPARKPVKKGDVITEEMLPELAYKPKYDSSGYYYDNGEYYYYDPSEDEQTFDGWYYDELFLDKVEVGDVIEGGLTLYAKWKNANVYIYFCLQNGYLEKYDNYDYGYDYSNGKYYEYKKYYYKYKIGTELSSINLPIPYYNNSNYIFLGWYLDKDYKTPAEGHVLESSITLYAKERYDGYFSIRYSTMWYYSDQPESKSLKAGEKLDSYYLPQLTPYSDYENYEFMGWYYDSEYTRKAQEGDEVNSDIWLYAKWEQKYVDISYWSNYSFADLPESRKIEKGSTLLLDYMPELVPPSGYDYRFAGWYYDSESNAKAQVGDVIDRNITLYAIWEPIHITLYYDTRGYADYIEPKVLDNGSTLTADLLPDPVPDSSYGNLVFVGWYYDSSYDMPAYTGDILNSESIWLYAKYDAMPNGTFLQYWVYDDTVSDDYEFWDSLTTVYNPTYYTTPEEIQFRYYYAGEESISYDSYYYDGVEYTNGTIIKRYYVKREISSNNLARLLSLYRAYDCVIDLTITDSNPDLEEMASTLRNDNTMRCSINLWLNDCTQLTSIPENCFKDVPYLVQVRLPDSIQTIGKNAFKGCSDLKYFHMYPSVTLIEEAAFEDCPLNSVYYSGSEDDKANITINDTTILNTYWYYNWY